MEWFLLGCDVTKQCWTLHLAAFSTSVQSSFWCTHPCNLHAQASPPSPWTIISSGLGTGGHPGTRRAVPVGKTWCTRQMAKPRPPVGRVCRPEVWECAIPTTRILHNSPQRSVIGVWNLSSKRRRKRTWSRDRPSRTGFDSIDPGEHRGVAAIAAPPTAF